VGQIHLTTKFQDLGQFIRSGSRGLITCCTKKQVIVDLPPFHAIFFPERLERNGNITNSEFIMQEGHNLLPTYLQELYSNHCAVESATVGFSFRSSGQPLLRRGYFPF